MKSTKKSDLACEQCGEEGLRLMDGLCDACTVDSREFSADWDCAGYQE